MTNSINQSSIHSIDSQLTADNSSAGDSSLCPPPHNISSDTLRSAGLATGIDPNMMAVRAAIARSEGGGGNPSSTIDELFELAGRASAVYTTLNRLRTKQYNVTH